MKTISLNDFRSAEENGEIFWRDYVRNYDPQVVENMARAFREAHDALLPPSTNFYAKVTIGEHRIWVHLYTTQLAEGDDLAGARVLTFVNPETKDRGFEPKNVSVSGPFLNATMRDSLEIYAGPDPYLAFEALFRDYPFILERAEREHYDAISRLRAMEYLEITPVAAEDQLGQQRLVSHVEAMRAKIRKTFQGLEDFLPAIRELR